MLWIRTVMGRVLALQGVPILVPGACYRRRALGRDHPGLWVDPL